MFHEKSKCMEIDYHCIQEKLLSKELCIDFVESNNQLVNVLIKSLRALKLIYLFQAQHIQFVCSNLRESVRIGLK